MSLQQYHIDNSINIANDKQARIIIGQIKAHIDQSNIKALLCDEIEVFLELAQNELMNEGHYDFVEKQNKRLEQIKQMYERNSLK